MLAPDFFLQIESHAKKAKLRAQLMTATMTRMAVLITAVLRLLVTIEATLENHQAFK